MQQEQETQKGTGGRLDRDIGGSVIILALILPAGFWWFALAAALIAGGIWLLRSCN